MEAAAHAKVCAHAPTRGTNMEFLARCQGECGAGREILTCARQIEGRSEDDTAKLCFGPQHGPTQTNFERRRRGAIAHQSYFPA